MTDRILTDEELNALFSVASSLPGGADTGAADTEVREYDFKNPRPFIHQHTRALEAIHQDFAGAAGSALSAYFGIPVQIVMHSVYEQRIPEYFGGMSRAVFLNYFKITPMEKFGLVELSNDLALSMIDRILGGEGKPANNRPLTEIELALMREPAARLLENLDFSWKGKVDRIGFEISRSAMSPSWKPAGLGDRGGEKVFIAHFELKLGLSIGEMNVCIPQSALKPFAAELLSSSEKERLPSEAAHITQADMDEVRLPVTAFMGEVPVAIGEFLKLQKGDIIPIIRVNENVELKVSDSVRIAARLGCVKHYRAVQIVAVSPL